MRSQIWVLYTQSDQSMSFIVTLFVLSFTTLSTEGKYLLYSFCYPNNNQTTLGEGQAIALFTCWPADALASSQHLSVDLSDLSLCHCRHKKETLLNLKLVLTS